MTIGVFDSGFGGLCILKALRQALPQYNYVYLGDSKRNPYGTRSDETIVQWSRECVAYLMERASCRLVIVACHTASNVALRQLQQNYLKNSPWPERRILGVTIPLVERACELSKRRVGVIATKATCRSGGFAIEIHKRRPELQVVQQPATILVSMIEEGLGFTSENKRLLKRHLRPLKQAGIDTLILGCTHFPLLYGQFKASTGKSVLVLDTAQIVGASLEDYLQRHPEMESSLDRGGHCTYLTTDSPSDFALMGKRFLGQGFVASQVQVET